MLVVEDDPELARLLSRYLGTLGYETAIAADGDTGVERFSSGEFDVVIVDGHLPGRDGMAVTRAIRASPRGEGVGVLMLTAVYTTAGARALAEEAGVDRFFVKPFIVTELREAIESLVEQGAQRRPRATPRATPTAEPDSGWMAEWRAPRPVTDAALVPRLLLTLARERASALLRLEDGGDVLEVAFLRGVPVGARGTLREDRLGERLVKRGRLTPDEMLHIHRKSGASGERVGEVAVELGLLDAGEVLSEIEGQAQCRLERAAGWRGGRASIVEGARAAERLAVGALDVQEAILRAALVMPDTPLHEDLAIERGRERVLLARDFEDALVAFARVAPSSQLPVALLGETRALREVLALVPGSVDELMAMRAAGMVRLESDPPFPAGALPRTLAPDESERAARNRDAIRRLDAALLRVRGSDLYARLDVDESAPAGAIEEALRRARAWQASLVAEAAGVEPSAHVAKELTALFDEAEEVLLHPERRRAYDDELSAAAGRRAEPQIDLEAERALLEGQTYLSLGDAARARRCFEQAASRCPTDGEYVAWLGWAMLLEGSDPEERALAILESAAAVAPQSTRPLLFLGLAAERRGDLARARRFLLEAARRAPDDAEVHRALAGITSRDV